MLLEEDKAVAEEKVNPEELEGIALQVICIYKNAGYWGRDKGQSIWWKKGGAVDQQHLWDLHS